MNFFGLLHLISIATSKLKKEILEDLSKIILKKAESEDFEFISKDCNLPMHVLKICKSRIVITRYDTLLYLTREITISFNKYLDEKFELKDELKKKLVKIVYEFRDKNKSFYIVKNKETSEYRDIIYNLMKNLSNYSHYINNNEVTKSFLTYNEDVKNNPSSKDSDYTSEFISNLSYSKGCDHFEFKFCLTQYSDNIFIYNINMNEFNYKKYLEYYLKNYYYFKRKELNEILRLLSLINISRIYIDREDNIVKSRVRKFEKCRKIIESNENSLFDQDDPYEYFESVSNSSKKDHQNLQVGLFNNKIYINTHYYVKNSDNKKHNCIDEGVFEEMKIFFKTCGSSSVEKFENILRFFYLIKDSKLYKDILISILSNTGKARNLIMYEILFILGLVEKCDNKLNLDYVNPKLIKENDNSKSEYYKKLSQFIIDEISYHHNNISSIYFDLLMYFEICEMYEKKITDNFSNDTKMLFKFIKSVKNKSKNTFDHIILCINEFLSKIYQKENNAKYGYDIYEEMFSDIKYIMKGPRHKNIKKMFCINRRNIN